MDEPHSDHCIAYGKPFVLRRIADTMSGDEFECFNSDSGYWCYSKCKCLSSLDMYNLYES